MSEALIEQKPLKTHKIFEELYLNLIINGKEWMEEVIDVPYFDCHGKINTRGRIEMPDPILFFHNEEIIKFLLGKELNELVKWSPKKYSFPEKIPKPYTNLGLSDIKKHSDFMKERERLPKKYKAIIKDSSKFIKYLEKESESDDTAKIIYNLLKGKEPINSLEFGIERKVEVSSEESMRVYK